MRVDAGVVLLAAAVTAPAAGQDAVRLRYTPTPGLAVATVTVFTTAMTVTGLPAVPDGTVFEEERRVYARQQVGPRTADGWLLEATLDSIRARTRAAGGAWRDRPASPLEGATVRARVNERFAVTGVESSGERDAEVLRVRTAWTAGLDAAFPEAPVSVGAAFETGGRMPFTAEVRLDTVRTVRETIFGDLALRLDSLTDRGTDTLLYFSFRGRFAPRTLEAAGEAGDVRASFQGTYAGSLIWSTGWDGFVSAVARMIVEAALTGTDAGGRNDATVRWETTISHRVRP